MNPSLIPFFDPQGIVIIGASSSPEKLGHGVARNLVQSGYAGAIHFVNPKGGILFERSMATSVADIPEPIDLAILIVPAQAAPVTLEQVGRRGIKAAIITSGGFRETGMEGAALEARLVEIAARYKMRIIGPNCIGMLDTHLPLDTTFLQPPAPPPGEVAFVSHSGAICAAIIDWARSQGFGFSRLVSLGNQADVTETDVLPFVADDPYTHVLTLYLESITNGENFVRVARQVAAKKPIVALKVGRSEAGQRAAASHTGALAGTESAYDAAFERAGVFRARTTEEMFDWARALANCPLPGGQKIGILTNAGGPGVIAADALEFNGLTLATFSSKSEGALSELLPPAASVHNPVDMLASATPGDYAKSLEIILQDEGVHGVIIVIPPPPMIPAELVAEAVIPVIKQSGKPVVIALMGSDLIDKAFEQFSRAGIPAYPFPERAAAALGILTRRARFLAESEMELTTGQFKLPGNVSAGIENSAPGSWLTAELVTSLLDAYSIRNEKLLRAQDEDEVAQLAERVGFPLVMKVASAEIPHKSDAGGVILDISSARQAREAFRQIVERIRAAFPGASIQGVDLQRQLPPGQEVIIGAFRDRQFGPLVMFGSGGVEVEGLKDVAFSLAPLTRQQAVRLIERTWAGKKLAGFRSIPPADQDSVVDVLVRMSHLAYDTPEIGEIEINPLRVFAPGSGVSAVDCRIKLVE